MARGVYSSSNYFSYDGALVSAPPMSFSCWCYASAFTTTFGLMEICHIGGAGVYPDGWNVRALTTGKVEVQAGTGAVLSTISTAGTASTNTWYQAGGIFASNVARYAVLNGVLSTKDAANTIPTAPDKSIIGVTQAQDASFRYSGTTAIIAEAGFWNVALTAADMLMLAAGYSPLMVKPESLVAYYPLIRGDSSGDEPDLIGGAKMVEQGTVDVQTHPRVFYPGLPWVVGKPGATAASGNPYYAFAQQQ